MATEYDMFLYLDGLRESGVTNMLHAGPYLMDEFSIGPKRAREVLLAWMKTHSGRHPIGEKK